MAIWTFIKKIICPIGKIKIFVKAGSKFCQKIVQRLFQSGKFCPIWSPLLLQSYSVFENTNERIQTHDLKWLVLTNKFVSFQSKEVVSLWYLFMTLIPASVIEKYKSARTKLQTSGRRDRWRFSNKFDHTGITLEQYLWDRKMLQTYVAIVLTFNIKVIFHSVNLFAK